MGEISSPGQLRGVSDHYRRPMIDVAVALSPHNVHLYPLTFIDDGVTVYHHHQGEGTTLAINYLDSRESLSWWGWPMQQRVVELGGITPVY